MTKLYNNKGEPTLEIGVGPISVNIEMARKLGWSDELISSVCDAVALLSRGALESEGLTSGRICEGCGAAHMDTRQTTDCALCNRQG